MSIQRDHWFAEGLKILTEKGFGQVRLEVLCERLQVTKGSFYHHFGSMDRYIDALLVFWEHSQAGQWHFAAEDAPDADGRLSRLMSEMLQDAAGRNVEQQLMAWARADRTVNEVVNRVHRQRREFVRRQFGRIHQGDPYLADLQAQLYWACFLGFVQLGLSDDEQDDLAELQRMVGKRIINNIP